MRPMNILLCVTGSIAAYKAAMLCRLFKSAGCEVRVVMTKLAKEFITPLTMATLSKNPILVEFFNPENGEWNSHVSLGEWADVMVIAPATANTMAKMATGVADNLLLTTYLSARAPVVVAPAMDLDMYAHVTTQQNLATLRSHGVHIVEPESGELASGLVGKGRMAEPQQIFDYVMEMGEERGVKKKRSLEGKHFVVTAGATIEAIDPVRYISNHSTGKMGYAIAGALAERGARVTLVSGRTALDRPEGVDRVDVMSAEQMYMAAKESFVEADGAVMCAAVADYTPCEVATQKIKKSSDDMQISLKKTVDIAAALGREKGGRLLVGFALETDNEEANAESKLERKSFDFIVLNSLRDAGAGFGVDTNKVTLIDREGREELALMSKREVAERIVDKIEGLC
ncbi:MAG: bifunctional phosphopantothenoylcysteine decarboxylase/phosphopantothenate--cysteine ligase CoaBC [Rikenellaceae bacterium]